MRRRASSTAKGVRWTPRPLTPAQLRAIEEGRAAIRRGDLVTLDEAEAYVARQRSKPAQGRRHKVHSG